MSSLMQQVTSGNTTYLKIVKGSFRQEVEEGTPGSKAREWEANGNSGVKHELIFKNLTGQIAEIKIEDINFKDGKGMNVLKVTIQNGDEKAQFTTETKSKFAIDFMKKLPNLTPGEEVVINPYDFEDSNGKRRTAFNIMQGGQKVYSAFWDNDKKKVVGKIPTVSKEDAADYDSDDWKIHFTKEKKWLIKNTQSIMANYVVSNVEDQTGDAGGEDENPDDLPF